MRNVWQSQKSNQIRFCLYAGPANWLVLFDWLIVFFTDWLIHSLIDLLALTDWLNDL